jgi:hypothetical protein
LFSRVCGSATLRPNNSFKPNATSGVGLILALGPIGGNLVFGFLKRSRKPSPPQPPRFPPVPNWRPEVEQPLDDVVKSLCHYTNGKKDFAVFRFGTFALIPNGLDDSDAIALALRSLHNVFHAHVDMRNADMDDGNVLVSYNHDVGNVALNKTTSVIWADIEAQHQRALATHEVLITPLGSNKFDTCGKKALFARCYMFMDAQAPEVVQLVRHVA